jgi:hypothetical protein
LREEHFIEGENMKTTFKLLVLLFPLLFSGIVMADVTVEDAHCSFKKLHYIEKCEWVTNYRRECIPTSGGQYCTTIAGRRVCTPLPAADRCRDVPFREKECREVREYRERPLVCNESMASYISKEVSVKEFSAEKMVLSLGKVENTEKIYIKLTVFGGSDLIFFDTVKPEQFIQVDSETTEVILPWSEVLTEGEYDFDILIESPKKEILRQKFNATL